jgi:putative Ca2+/H+ antiporter (TMEM165/GDT1 family)
MPVDLKLFATVFVTILLAELGDKTQLATLLYASDATHGKLTVFLAAASALTLSAGLGVLGGSVLGGLVHPRVVRLAAGMAFIAIGVWMLVPARGPA